MKKLIAVLVVLAALVIPSSARATSIGPSWNPNGNYTQTFDDEFNGTAINTSNWNTTWWLNKQNPLYTACYKSSHDSESGGYAHLLLTKTPSTCFGKTEPNTGAILTTYKKFSQEGGAFEARVYLPCANKQVYGFPAVWSNDPTFNAEMDWVEGGAIASGQIGGTAAHLHYAGGDPGMTSPLPKCGWHRFGVQWDATAKTATFYWDTVKFFSHSFPVSGFKDYLILDYQAGCGPNTCTIAPPFGGVTMLVDWIRVWKTA